MNSEGFQHCQGKLEHHQTDLSDLLNQDIGIPKLLLKGEKKCEETVMEWNTPKANGLLLECKKTDKKSYLFYSNRW